MVAQCACLQIKRSGFELFLGTLLLDYVLGQDTLFDHSASPPWHMKTLYWGLPCDGLASHTGWVGRNISNFMLQKLG